jgi:Zn-dependent peptidase ImmA (M78 family)/DNA-binding XRE family transcriptional regulator
MFTPGRLSLARKRRGLTKKGLATLIGVTPRTILRYEIGEIAPQNETAAKIAAVLGFPIEFFHADDVDEPAADAASFRSLTAITAAERDAALAAGSVAFLLSDWIDQRFDLPPVSLIDLSDTKPEAAARSLRQEWALGERPITNMVHLLESKGMRVFSLSENTRTVDAFSLWRSDRPFVFLNMMKTPEHSRFDAAHELGHLVLHKHGGPKGRKAEEQANLFASSFLMPAGDVMAAAPRIHNIHQVVEAKKRWKVSALALIYRLYKVGVLSPWQYRMFCIQASDLGYRKAEPFGIVREQSVIWQKVLTALWKERVTKEEIARAIHVPSREIENLLFGLANMLSQDGDDNGKKSPGGLRLVSG